MIIMHSWYQMSKCDLEKTGCTYATCYMGDTCQLGYPSCIFMQCHCSCCTAAGLYPGGCIPRVGKEASKYAKCAVQ